MSTVRSALLNFEIEWLNSEFDIEFRFDNNYLIGM